MVTHLRSACAPLLLMTALAVVLVLGEHDIGRHTTRGAAGTTRKRSMGPLPAGIFIYLYTKCPESYGILTCAFAVTSYVEGVRGT
jgi:hypothetical protein